MRGSVTRVLCGRYLPFCWRILLTGLVCRPDPCKIQMVSLSGFRVWAFCYRFSVCSGSAYESRRITVFKEVDMHPNFRCGTKKFRSRSFVAGFRSSRASTYMLYAPQPPQYALHIAACMFLVIVSFLLSKASNKHCLCMWERAYSYIVDYARPPCSHAWSADILLDPYMHGRGCKVPCGYFFFLPIRFELVVKPPT
jgi:hypothetical protein